MTGPRTTFPGFNEPRYRALIERLRHRRAELGVTQKELAMRLGTHKQFISRVELGERRLDVVEFADYAAALDLIASEVLDAIRPKVRSDG